MVTSPWGPPRDDFALRATNCQHHQAMEGLGFCSLEPHLGRVSEVSKPSPWELFRTPVSPTSLFSPRLRHSTVSHQGLRIPTAGAVLPLALLCTSKTASHTPAMVVKGKIAFIVKVHGLKDAGEMESCEKHF